jgi:hypothetical protein
MRDRSGLLAAATTKRRWISRRIPPSWMLEECGFEILSHHFQVSSDEINFVRRNQCSSLALSKEPRGSLPKREGSPSVILLYREFSIKNSL